MGFTRRRLIQAAAGIAAVGVGGAARAEDDGVGAVNDIVNVAWATLAGTPRDEVDDQDPVFMGELIETEDESAVVILFADGSKLTIGENARLTIDNFVYNPGGSGSAAAIKLVKG